MKPTAGLICGDCLQVLPTLEAGSVDAVVTDPPYPCIKRSYGTWTEAEWWEMMRAVVPECMRVLKPHGSAVFVLQPNSERAGRMRTWLWEFMAWAGKEWGIVQDAWWWNYESLPRENNRPGLMRPSVKACVWLGGEDCHRDQGSVLWSESEGNKTERLVNRAKGAATRRPSPSGYAVLNRKMGEAALKRGGVTPFNPLPLGGCNRWDSAGSYGHGAGTPLALAAWWLRYICPPGGTALDPFSGTATVGVAALRQGKGYVGIERMPEYHAIAARRLAEAQPPARTLFDPVEVTV